VHWYLIVLRKYAVFRGRARRKEFWLFALVSFLIALLLEVADSAFGLTRNVGLADVYSLLVFVPTTAVAVRRLHDTNRSGWWLLIGPAPSIGSFLLYHFYFFALASQDRVPQPPERWPFPTLVLMFIGNLVLFVFLVKDSQPTENRHGPNPKIAAFRS
jgi:uncharacterized membrane protein YhaH (DUF805 family)